MNKAEERAVWAALSGDCDPLGEILEQYRPRLERMVRFRMDRRLAARMEPGDIVQEAIVGILEGFSTRFPRSTLELFLWVRLETGQMLRAVHRKHLGTLARDAGREIPIAFRSVPGASSFAFASALLDAQGTPSRAAMAKERGRKLHQVIASMKDVDREVLVLRHFEMLSNAEVARILCLSQPAATLRYVRALKRLRAELDALEITLEGSG